MAETLRQADQLSLFQKMLRGQIAARFILNSSRLEVAAIVDIHPAEHAQGAQAVVFPYAAGSSQEWDMATRMKVAAATQAVSRQIMRAYRPDLVVKHEEGYGVRNPEHGHVVLLPSFDRGQSIALHDPERLQQPVPAELLDAAQQKLHFGVEQTVAFEQETWQGAGRIYGLL